MIGKEALERIQTRTYPYFLGLYEQKDYVEDIKTIERDLELLDSLLDVFKKDILEAFDSYYRDGDNIITKRLIEQLGMVTLKKLKERINKNE